MEIKHTVEILTKDIQDIEKLVRNLNNYETPPQIEIDLAMSKLRNVYDLLSIISRDMRSDNLTGQQTAATGFKGTTGTVPSGEAATGPAQPPAHQHTRTEEQVSSQPGAPGDVQPPSQPLEKEEVSPQQQAQAEAQAPPLQQALSEEKSSRQDAAPQQERKSQQDPAPPQQTTEQAQASSLQQSSSPEQSASQQHSSSTEQSLSTEQSSSKEQPDEPDQSSGKPAEAPNRQEQPPQFAEDEKEAEVVPAAGPAHQKKEEIKKASILAERFATDKSLNEKIAPGSGHDLSSKLTGEPIDSIKRNIGINDRFLIIRELMEGDSDAFNELVHKLDTQHHFDEAYEIIQSSFPDQMDHEGVNLLVRLSRRRYLGR